MGDAVTGWSGATAHLTSGQELFRRWSPDGREIAFSREEREVGSWIVDAKGGERVS